MTKEEDFVYKNFADYKHAQVHTFGSFESGIHHWAEGQARFIRSWMDSYLRDLYILDVACGDGVGLRVFKELGFTNVVGADFSKPKLDRAKEVGFPVHEVDMHDMSVFPDATFDVIYSSHSLEHALDPGKVLKEFSRILKPNGEVALVLPYPDVGEREKHCAKHILGSDRDDDAAALTSFLWHHGFIVQKKVYDSFREVEVWMRLTR